MSGLNYKGFVGIVAFDPDDLILTGRVAGINDVVGFHGRNGQDVVAAFHEAVDDYIETCAKMGKEPERPYSGKVMLRVDPGVHARAALAAELAGKSLNQFGEGALQHAAEQVVRERVASWEFAPQPIWQDSETSDPSIWGGGHLPLIVNTGHGGSERVVLPAAPRGYARLIPSAWEPDAEAELRLNDATSHPWPLGDARSLSWGRTNAGILAWRVDKDSGETGRQTSATRWFRDTGEFWGVANECFYAPSEGERRVAVPYLLKRWRSFVEYHAQLAEQLGGEGPYHIVLGLTGLDGSLWPSKSPPYHGEVFEAVESRVEYRGALSEPTPAALRVQLKAAGDCLRRAFGFSPYSDDQFNRELGGTD